MALSHYLGNDEVMHYAIRHSFIWNSFDFLHTIEYVSFQTSVAVRKNFELCYYTDQCLKRLEYDEKLAVAVSRLHAENTPALSRSEMFCFPRSKNIYSYSIAMPIKLDYHLLPIINYNIRQLFEFGLTERWNKLSQAIAANEEIKKMLNRAAAGENDNRLVVLTVPHIMGALLIMSFGHIVALTAFCIELWINKKISHIGCAKIWLILHFFLNPK